MRLIQRQVIHMNKFWNWIRDEDTGERVLRLDGVITDSDFFAELFGLEAATPKYFRNELNSADGDITVRINSEGGDAFAAAAIYTMLKDYGNTKGRVTVKIDGLAASAASVVAMAGDVIEISPVGMIMIHNPWLWTQGDADEMRTAARFLDDVKETIINAYETKTKLPRDEISRMMDDETWFHASKAVELGFADKIMFAENQSAGDSVNNMSSRRQVMNCLTDAIKARLAAEKKSASDNRVDAVQLHKRLNLLRR